MPKVKVAQPDGEISITQGSPYRQGTWNVANNHIEVGDADLQLVLDHVPGAHEVVTHAAGGKPTRGETAREHKSE